MVEPQTATNVTVTFSADLVNPGRHRIVRVVMEDGKEVSSETLGEEDYFFDTFEWKWEIGEHKGGGEGQSYTTEPISLRPGVYSVKGELTASRSDCGECKQDKIACTTNLYVGVLSVALETKPWKFGP